MNTKKNIGVLTVAALFAVALVFGLYGCPGNKPGSGSPSPAATSTPKP